MNNRLHSFIVAYSPNIGEFFPGMWQYSSENPWSLELLSFYYNELTINPIGTEVADFYVATTIFPVIQVSVY
jgi:hypothetical protein